MKTPAKSAPLSEPQRETRFQRIAREQAERQARRAKLRASVHRVAKRAGWKVTDHKTAAERIADRIDGYDRDDLGESPDY